MIILSTPNVDWLNKEMVLHDKTQKADNIQ